MIPEKCKKAIARLKLDPETPIYTDFKEMIEKEGIKPENLISFGDGYVELELIDKIGGYAVGAATDEVRRCGIDEWKRNRLLSAGAGMIIPDFSNYE